METFRVLLPPLFWSQFLWSSLSFSFLLDVKGCEFCVSIIISSLSVFFFNLRSNFIYLMRTTLSKYHVCHGNWLKNYPPIPTQTIAQWIICNVCSTLYFRLQSKRQHNEITNLDLPDTRIESDAPGKYEKKYMLGFLSFWVKRCITFFSYSEFGLIWCQFLSTRMPCSKFNANHHIHRFKKRNLLSNIIKKWNLWV